MKRSKKKLGDEIAEDIPQDRPALKHKFISNILKSQLDEDSRINLIGGLVGTFEEGLTLKVFNEDRKNRLSSSGGDGKAEAFKKIDDFAKKKYYECRDSHPRWSNEQFAKHLITEHGAEKVGSLDPLRKKIGRWKKEDK